MASTYLNDMTLSRRGDSASVDTALHAFEKDMFSGSSQDKAQDNINDATPDTLRYLFAIFR